MAANHRQFLFLVGRFLKTSLKLLGQMNQNLVGSTYGRFCIKFPQSRMKGEWHRLSGERWVTQAQPKFVYLHLMQFKRYQALLVCFIGLRTLCIATTEISEELYDEWKHTYYKASTSIQNRDKKLEEAAELIERVIGVSLK